MNWTKPHALLVLIAMAVPCAFTSGCNNARIQPRSAAADQSSTPLKFDRLDPAADGIIPAAATLERVATGFTWIEGPVWDQDSLYFADIPSNSIRKWTQARRDHLLRPQRLQRLRSLRRSESGTNGMTLDARDASPSPATPSATCSASNPSIHLRPHRSCRHLQGQAPQQPE